MHVIPALRTGGAEHALFNLVTAKRTNALQQAVVDLSGGGDFTESIRSAGIQVYELGMRNPASLPMALSRLVRLIKWLRPSAIQSWLYYADLLSLWALERSGRRSATRLCWGIRCSRLETNSQRRVLRWTVAACASRSDRADLVVANSFAGRHDHLQLGYTPRAFPVIPNGVDMERFRPDAATRHLTRAELGINEGQMTVIHVARVDPMKDHAALLAVAAALPQIRFLAVGDGTELLNAPPNLTALGKRSGLPALYNAADAALSTSAFGEGFSNVIAEAMASGVSVVATDVGDSRRIVGETGVIVPPRDIAATTAAVRRLTSEPAEQRRLRASAGRARVEQNFSLAGFVAAFDALHLHGVLPEDDPGSERNG
jgi:glycosyltransferase involved in cell wall biosynthesis